MHHQAFWKAGPKNLQCYKGLISTLNLIEIDVLQKLSICDADCTLQYFPFRTSNLFGNIRFGLERRVNSLFEEHSHHVFDDKVFICLLKFGKISIKNRLLLGFFNRAHCFWKRIAFELKKLVEALFDTLIVYDAFNHIR